MTSGLSCSCNGVGSFGPAKSSLCGPSALMIVALTDMVSVLGSTSGILYALSRRLSSFPMDEDDIFLGGVAPLSCDSKEPLLIARLRTNDDPRI